MWLARQRHLGNQQRAAASVASDLQHPAEGLDTVLQPDEPRPCADAGPADAVVFDRNTQTPVIRIDAHCARGGLCMLDRIRESFRHHVVGGHFE